MVPCSRGCYLLNVHSKNSCSPVMGKLGLAHEFCFSREYEPGRQSLSLCSYQGREAVCVERERGCFRSACWMAVARQRCEHARRCVFKPELSGDSCSSVGIRNYSYGFIFSGSWENGRVPFSLKTLSMCNFSIASISMLAYGTDI